LILFTQLLWYTQLLGHQHLWNLKKDTTHKTKLKIKQHEHDGGIPSRPDIMATLPYHSCLSLICKKKHTACEGNIWKSMLLCVFVFLCVCMHTCMLCISVCKPAYTYKHISTNVGPDHQLDKNSTSQIFLCTRNCAYIMYKT
jgi:hypothetical protein